MFFEYFFIIGAITFIESLLYTFLPIKFTGEKNKYISYILYDISVLWFIYIFFLYILKLSNADINQLIALFFIPISAIIYWIFPFKNRNKTFSFIITSIAIIEVFSIFCLYVLVFASNM